MSVRITSSYIGRKATVTCKNNLLIFKSSVPIKNYSIDVSLIFDLLKDCLSTKSKNIGIRRRALQLSGISLKDVIKKLS